MIFALSVYEQSALSRAQSVEILGTEVRYVSLEDLIIHKIIAGRPRDLEDVRKVLIKQKSVDLKLILHWLSLHDRELEENFEETFRKIQVEVSKPY